MVNDPMKAIAIVPARSGSKGFVHKNIAKIQGRTLIELAVQVGLDCSQVEQVYISTDDPGYEQIALQAGATSLGLRHSDLATDTAKSADVVIDLVNRLEKLPEFVVLLQPTAPMRRPEDISQMLALVMDSDADAIVSVEKLDEPHPNKLKQITEQGFVAPFLTGTSSEIPRQLLPDVFKLNGAIYIIRTSSLLADRTFLPPKTLPYAMSFGINIDTELDYHILLGLLSLGKIEIYGTRPDN